MRSCSRPGRQAICAAATAFKTLLIWPYAVAPAIAGVLWIFMFHPSLGTLGRIRSALGIDWNPLLNGTDAMILLVISADVEADQLQFPVLPRGPAGDPEKRDRGGGHRRRRPAAALLDDRLPAAVADDLLPSRRHHRLRVLRHVRHHRRGDRAAARPADDDLVYKVYADGRLGGDLGGSAAQSVILMVIVIALTAIQFRYVERKVQY